jgi:hypothetical protein
MIFVVMDPVRAGLFPPGASLGQRHDAHRCQAAVTWAPGFGG